MATIAATRHELNDRFEILGFTVKTGGKPFFEVAIATEPALFRDRARRTRTNFFSTRASGPLYAERGEAVFLVPPEVLKRFAGQARIYYGLATFADGGGAQPEIGRAPDDGSPWVNLSGYTGRARRRVMALPTRRGTTRGDGYDPSRPEELEWAGDAITKPGTEAIAPAPAKTPGNGNGGRAIAAPAAPVAPTPAESASFVYDDGFGAMPAEPVLEHDAETGIDGPIEDDGTLTQGLGYARPFTETAEYPGASSFVAARHFTRPRAPRTIARLVIHITDGQGRAQGTADYFRDPQQWMRVDEADGAPQLEMEGDRCVRFLYRGRWKECVNGRTRVQGAHTQALGRVSTSAHYVVGQDGEVIQMVRHAEIAHHASSANGDSIGIEHNARTPRAFARDDAGLFPTEEQYRASARLVCWLAREFGIPKDRTHILGHAEADPGTSHTACPAAVWDWDRYMAMITDGSCEPEAVAQAQGARSFSEESFSVAWDDVELVPQLNGMSCWAASAAMVVGWRDRLSIDPADIAGGLGDWKAYSAGLYPKDHAALGDAWGLVKEPPQSYSVEGFRRLLEQSGPLWIGVAVPSGHAVVVTGLSGDGTPAGTIVRYHDPWPPDAGAAAQSKSFETFIREYENRITSEGDTVNVQILHAGGRGAAAQSLARALEFSAFTPEAIERMRQEFVSNSAAGSPQNCITISNAGLRQLYGAALQNADGSARALGSTIQDTMARLESYGLAEPRTVFEFNDAAGALTKGVARPAALQSSIESWLLSEAEKGQASAPFVFGLSIMDGYHSVILALDFSGSGDPATKLHWADQIGSGWDDVTAALDARITAKTQGWWDPLPPERKARTRVTVWPLRPGVPPPVTQNFSAPRRRSRAFTVEGEDGIEGMEEESALLSQPQTASECTDAFCPVASAPSASTTHFSLDEFRCRDGTAAPERFRGNVQEVMNNLEVLRAELGQSITINSGYRTCAYNSTLEGAASRSRHLCGQAADIRVAEHTPAQVHAAIERLITAGRMKEGGLGLYKTFVHYDVRGTRARWDRTGGAT